MEESCTVQIKVWSHLPLEEIPRAKCSNQRDWEFSLKSTWIEFPTLDSYFCIGCRFAAFTNIKLLFLEVTTKQCFMHWRWTIELLCPRNFADVLLMKLRLYTYFFRNSSLKNQTFCHNLLTSMPFQTQIPNCLNKACPTPKIVLQIIFFPKLTVFWSPKMALCDEQIAI